MSLFTTSTLSVQDICAQRTKKQGLFVPRNRIELSFPDPSFSTFQLDMRRKAEILKYDKTASKATPKTRKGLFSSLINTVVAPPINNVVSYNKKEDAFERFAYNDPADVCPATIVSTPAGSSDVPGNIDLFLDPSVPLYNYKLDRTYGENQPLIDLNVYAQSQYDTSMSYTTYTNAISIYPIKVETPNTTCNISIPVSFYMYGVGTTDIQLTNINALFTSIDYRLMFNDHIIKNGSAVLPEISDISFNIDVSNGLAFKAEFPLGNLNIPDISMNTTSDYVYDIIFQPSFNVGFPPITITSTSTSLDFGLISHSTGKFENQNITFLTTPLSAATSVSIQSTAQDGSALKTVFQYKSDALTDTTTTTPTPTTTPPAVRTLTDRVFVSKYNYNGSPIYELRNTTLRNDIYYVEDASYTPGLTYKVTDGTYYLVNIPADYPMTVLNDWCTDKVEWINNNDVGVQSYNGTFSLYNAPTYQVSDTVAVSDLSENGTYRFIYNNVRMDICGNFDVSGLSFYNNTNGYMGGQRAIKYQS